MRETASNPSRLTSTWHRPGTVPFPAMSGSPRPASHRTEHAKHLFAGLPATYERMGAVLSFGQDPRWRRFMVGRVAARARLDGRVLDVATGTAAVARALAGSRQDLRIVCLDQSEPMLRQGAARIRADGLSARMLPLLGRGESLPFADASFDALTFTYLLRYVDDPTATIAELARVVKPGGIMASLEFHVPGPPWGLAWWAYTRGVMPVAGRVVSSSWAEVGTFLGRSISAFYRQHPLEGQLGWWRAAGFADVRARVMSLGGGVVAWGTKDAGR